MDKEFSLVYGAKIIAKKNSYVITFRDLKNVFAEGDTRVEALKAAQEVLDLLLEEMASDGVEIPDPTPIRKREYSISVSPKIAVPILLRKIRKRYHYSMVDIAESMGVTYQSYQQMEVGKNMTLKSLKQASNALGATPVIKFYVRESASQYQSKKK